MTLHTEFLKRLIGRTVVDVRHDDEPNGQPGREFVLITFDDGKKFKVWSLMSHTLDFRIEP